MYTTFFRGFFSGFCSTSNRSTVLLAGRAFTDSPGVGLQRECYSDADEGHEAWGDPKN